jgi:hypothetical protein
VQLSLTPFTCFSGLSGLGYSKTASYYDYKISDNKTIQIPYGDLYQMPNAIQAMTDRIRIVEAGCNINGVQCTPYDKLIIAAIAQNNYFGP